MYAAGSTTGSGMRLGSKDTCKGTRRTTRDPSYTTVLFYELCSKRYITHVISYTFYSRIYILLVTFFNFYSRIYIVQVIFNKLYSTNIDSSLLEFSSHGNISFIYVVTQKNPDCLLKLEFN